ncbi:MAG: hypothetical protein R3E01_15615 [Pirellulaceae bacterium]|nr:hypothetical protein [Planctomycetales bacterium]
MPKKLARNLPEGTAGRGELTACLFQSEIADQLCTSQRMLWWPRGVPQGVRHAIVSSYLGRSPELKPRWFRYLRTAVDLARKKDEIVLLCEGTTTTRYLRHGCRRSGIRSIDIRLDGVNWTPERWNAWVGSDEAMAMSSHYDEQNCCVWVSPVLRDAMSEAPADVPTKADTMSRIPLRDRLLVTLADHVTSLGVRTQGNVYSLLSAWLQTGRPMYSQLLLAVDCDHGSRQAHAQLMALGGVAWEVESSDEKQVTSPQLFVTPAANGATPLGECARVVGENDLDWCDIVASDYLTHWTRRTVGPWPDQTMEEYELELLEGECIADRSALGTLLRILSSGRLIASTRAIRGAFATVSLTAVPLPELLQLRTFRRHRGRWDFEHYGFCFSKRWLQDHGTREVDYGDDDRWSHLSDEDRPFFQRRYTTNASGREIDWSIEQEWRHLGDIDLNEIPANAAFLFVPSKEEIAFVRQHSRFPVIALAHYAV